MVELPVNLFFQAWPERRPDTIMSRRGKIARLPGQVREAVNRRLFDGETGEEIVTWLNGEPEVLAVLAREFGGKPVREQNLSEWRRGGYEDWLQYQQTRMTLRDLAEEGTKLDSMAKGAAMSDRVATILTIDLAQAARQRLSTADDAETRWKRLSGILKHLSSLRRQDHKAMEIELGRKQTAVKAASVEAELLRALGMRVKQEMEDPG